MELEFCFPCSKCDKKFDNLRLLKKHKLVFHEDVPLPSGLDTSLSEDVKIDNNTLNSDGSSNKKLELDNTNEQNAYIIGLQNGKDGTNQLSREDLFDTKRTRKCTVCGETRTAGAFRKHMEGHNKNSHKLIKCETGDCQEMFAWPKYQKRHKVEVHGIEKKKPDYTCKICGWRASSSSTLKAHVLRHEKEAEAKLNDTEASEKLSSGVLGFRLENGVRAPITRLNEKVKCPICGKLVVKYKRKIHEKIHDNQKLWLCDFKECSEKFSVKMLLEDHQQKEHGKTLICSICQYVARVPSEYDRHMIKHDGPGICCNECGKLFKTKLGLVTHMKRHREMFDFKCTECDKSFVSAGILNLHMKQSHMTPQFTCSLCGKLKRCKVQLKWHMAVHTGDKNYKCKFCDRSFRVPQQRRDHENIHLGIKQFECKECPKTFTKRNGLYIHMKRHRNQKDHVCDTCNKGFIEPAGLRKHKCSFENKS